MRVAMRERGSGASVTGRSSHRPALRGPSPVAIDTKGRQPQRPVLVLALLPTVTLKRLNLDASGTVASQPSGARPGSARDRLEISGSRDFENSRCESSPVTRRTSRTVAIELRTLPRAASSTIHGDLNHLDWRWNPLGTVFLDVGPPAHPKSAERRQETRIEMMNLDLETRPVTVPRYNHRRRMQPLPRTSCHTECDRTICSSRHDEASDQIMRTTQFETHTYRPTPDGADVLCSPLHTRSRAKRV